MIDLQKINTESALYPFVESLWLNAFPESERRDTDAQRANVAGNGAFSCHVVLYRGKPAGFITTWDFGTFCYCEHFATDAAVRGQGIGASIIKHVVETVGKPMLLEVEMPEDEMARRRIGFYRRCGFGLMDDYAYVQPAYRPGGEELPMMLMTSGVMSRAMLDDAVKTLRRHVYGCEE